MLGLDTDNSLRFQHQPIKLTAQETHIFAHEHVKLSRQTVEDVELDGITVNFFAAGEVSVLPSESACRAPTLHTSVLFRSPACAPVI
jgi:hypothetical protein